MEGTLPERRAHPRQPVVAGTAEITAVNGRGWTTRERVRVLDWSRGGVRLEVHSPQRRFFFLDQEPRLRTGDAVTCMLRLPPLYTEVEVWAEVARVERLPDRSDYLHVGVRFDDDATPPERLARLARHLEPRGRASASGNLRRPSARISGVWSSAAGSSSRRAAPPDAGG